MYSSPTAPTGTGCMSSSRMCSWVLATGLPMGTKGRGLARSHVQALTPIASVGPKRLCSSASSREKKRSWSAFDRTSPLQMTRLRLSAVAGPRVLQEQLQHRGHEVDRGDAVLDDGPGPGRRCRDDRPARRRRARRRSGSGQKNSHTEGSKLNGVFCRTLSVGRQAEVLLQPVHAVGDGPVRDHGPLGPARGARGEDDVGEVVGGHRRGSSVGVGRGHGLRTGRRWGSTLRTGAGQARDEALLREQDRLDRGPRA